MADNPQGEPSCLFITSPLVGTSVRCTRCVLPLMGISVCSFLKSPCCQYSNLAPSKLLANQGFANARESLYIFSQTFQVHPKSMTRCATQGSALGEHDPSRLCCGPPSDSEAIRSFTGHTSILCQCIYEPTPRSFLLHQPVIGESPYHEANGVSGQQI